MIKVNSLKEKKDVINEQDLMEFLLQIEEEFDKDNFKLDSFVEIFQNFQDEK